MEKWTQGGVRGFKDGDKFYPLDDFEKWTQDGVRGWKSEKHSTFIPELDAVPVPEAETWTKRRFAGAAATGVYGAGSLGAKLFRGAAKVLTHNVDDEGLKKEIDKPFEIEKKWDERIDALSKDPKLKSAGFKSPEAAAETLILGIIQFLPQAPIYQSVGGPVGNSVELAIASIAKRYGAKAAEYVARKLPEYIMKSGKFAFETGAHATGQFATGVSTQLAAGSDMKKALEEGEGFAVASTAFKILGLAWKEAAGKFMKGWKEGFGTPAPKVEAKEPGDLIAPPSKTKPRFTPPGEETPRTKKQSPPTKEKDIETVAYLKNELTRYQTFLGDAEGIQKHAEIYKTTPDKIAADYTNKVKGLIESIERIEKRIKKDAYTKPESTPKQENKSEKKPGSKKVESKAEDDAWDKYKKLKESEPVLTTPESPTMDFETGEIIPNAAEPPRPSSADSKRIAEFVENREIERRKADTGTADFRDIVPGLEREGDLLPPGDIQKLHSVPFLNPEEWGRSLRATMNPVLESKAYAQYRRWKQNMQDQLTTKSLPVMNRLGLGAEAVKVATAISSAESRAASLVADTLNFPINRYDADGKLVYSGPAYKSNEFMRLVEQTKNRDNILAGYDAAVENATKFKDRIDTLADDIIKHRHTIITIDQQAYNQLNRAKVVRSAKAKIRANEAEIKRLTELKDRAEKEAKNIEKAASELFKTEKNPNPDGLGIMNDFVLRQLQDPDIHTALYRWRNLDEGAGKYTESQWRRYKRLGDDVDSGYERGRHSGTRAHLRPLDLIDLEKPLPEGAAGARFSDPSFADKNWERRADVKMDKHDRRAMFTGTYSTDMVSNLKYTIGQRNENIARADLYDAMIDKGLMTPHGTRPPKEINGEKPVRFEYDYPVTEKRTLENGNEYQTTRMEGRTGYIPVSLEQELKNVTGMFPKKESSLLAKTLNTVQLAGFLDAIIHSNNLVKVVAQVNGVTEKVASEMIRKLPFVGRVDAAKRMYDINKWVMEDTPEVRGYIAELSELGLLRSHGYYKDTLQEVFHKIPAVGPMLEYMSDFIHKADVATRIILDQAFKDMAAKGEIKNTPENRRQFIEQAGQYHERLIQDWKRRARSSGLSPFIVAGTTMTGNAMRRVKGDVGAEVLNSQAALKNRLLMYWGTAMAGIIPAIGNIAMWGNAFGPDGNAPIGTMVLSKNKNGENTSVNFFNDSFMQRGMNATGIQLMNEVASGGYGIESKSKAAMRMWQAAIHPVTGPAATTATKLLGFDIGKLEKYGHSDDTALDRTREVFSELNPLWMGSLSDEPGRGPIERLLDGDGPDKGAGIAKHLDAIASPLATVAGIKTSKPSLTPAEQIVRQAALKELGPMSKKAEKELRAKEYIRSEFRKGTEIGVEAMKEVFQAGILNTKQIENTIKTLEATRLQRYAMNGKVKTADLMKAYESANARERMEILPFLLKRIDTEAKTLTPATVEKFKDDIVKFFEKNSAGIQEMLSEYARKNEAGEIPEPEE